LTIIVKLRFAYKKKQNKHIALGRKPSLSRKFKSYQEMYCKELRLTGVQRRMCVASFE